MKALQLQFQECWHQLTDLLDLNVPEYQNSAHFATHLDQPKTKSELIFSIICCLSTSSKQNPTNLLTLLWIMK